MGAGVWEARAGYEDTVIHIGFTGTRHGMTTPQWHAVEELVSILSRRDAPCAHHGDCVGADAQFHGIARNYGARIVIHPPVDVAHRAFCKSADEWRPMLTHLARNRAIVAESDVMIATPFEMTRQTRGGTWYTIDRAQKSGKPLAIVFPSGAVVRNEVQWP